jgi:hypothetical protein
MSKSTFEKILETISVSQGFLQKLVNKIREMQKNPAYRDPAFIYALALETTLGDVRQELEGARMPTQKVDKLINLLRKQGYVLILDGMSDPVMKTKIRAILVSIE